MNTGRQHIDMSSLPDDHLGQEDSDVRHAIRFAVVAAVAGVAFLVIAAVWASSCGADMDTVACGRPGRTLLGLGAPVILFASGLWAAVRTYRIWRAGRTWWGWQGAVWFLLLLMLLTLTLGFMPIAGVGVS